jgi:hypothetical protein
LGVVGEDAGALDGRLGRQDPYRLVQGGQAAWLVANIPTGPA